MIFIAGLVRTGRQQYDKNTTDQKPTPRRGGEVKHIINGCPVNLRTLTEEELANITATTLQRIERAQEELESLRGEQIRRSDNVHQLRFEYEGPAIA